LKPIHYISIGVAIALVIALFFGSNTVKPKEDTKNPSIAGTTPGEMQSAAMNLPAPIVFDSLLLPAQRLLSPAALSDIKAQEKIIADPQANNADKVLALEALGKLWQGFKNRPIAAHYFAESGKLENSEKKLNFAAHLLTEEIAHEQNPSIKQWMAYEALGCYGKLLEINPKNDTVQIDMAVMYIQGSGEAMKGVELLLSLVGKDSTHIRGNMVLGQMAIQSGQFDKAIARGNTILRVEPKNIEAHMFLAEAYKRKGQNEKNAEAITKAKALFTEAKNIMNNPEFSKEMDEYMKTF
jgi:tetratricopeptide (TPR) repeat protein